MRSPCNLSQTPRQFLPRDPDIQSKQGVKQVKLKPGIRQATGETDSSRLPGILRVAWSDDSKQQKNIDVRNSNDQTPEVRKNGKRLRAPSRLDGSETSRSAPSSARKTPPDGSPVPNRRAKSGVTRRREVVKRNSDLILAKDSSCDENDTEDALSRVPPTSRSDDYSGRSSRMRKSSPQSCIRPKSVTKHEMTFLSMVLDESPPRQQANERSGDISSRSQSHDLESSCDEIEAIEEANKWAEKLPKLGKCGSNNLQTLSSKLDSKQSVIIKTGHDGGESDENGESRQFQSKLRTMDEDFPTSTAAEAAHNWDKVSEHVKQTGMSRTKSRCGMARVSERKPAVVPVKKSSGEQRASLDKLAATRVRFERRTSGIDDIMDAYSTVAEGEHIDHEPILRYLTLVQGHPDVYSAMRERRPQYAREKDDGIIAVGKALGRPFGCSESLVVQAAYELGCWHLDPAWAKAVQDPPSKKDKNEASPEDFNMVKYLKLPPQIRCYIKIPGLDSLKKEGKATTKKKEPLTINTKLPMPMRVSEFEKHRGDVERWIRTLSTTDLIKSREKALSIMQESDKSIRRWWRSHQNCRYLRKRKTGKAKSADT